MAGISVTKEVQWDCAHQLLNHKGLCRNIHGHTYKLQVTVETRPDCLTESGSSESMVLDFSDLKKVLKQVVDKFDHAFVAKGDEPILPHLKELNYKVLELGIRTTAEEMSMWIFNYVEEEMRLMGLGDLDLKKVRLYETPTSYAEYEPTIYVDSVDASLLDGPHPEASPLMRHHE